MRDENWEIGWPYLQSRPSCTFVLSLGILRMLRAGLLTSGRKVWTAEKLRPKLRAGKVISGPKNHGSSVTIL
jgi:hypothetical protein